MIYFSSDWHFGHANIIKYDKRPFKDVDHMNGSLLYNYNNTVTMDDEFYFLGDFYMGDPTKMEWFFQHLIPNKKFFLRGNHDKKETVELYKKYGTYLGNMSEIKIEGTKVVLCHYAMKVWNQSHRGAYHLYGHSHGSLPEDPHSLSFDVGVNSWEYMPVSWTEVKAKMSRKDYKPIDHHGKRPHEIDKPISHV